MKDDNQAPAWTPGRVPVAVVMITLNEGHQMEAVLRNLAGWAQEVHVVDSFSRDQTVDIALVHGAHVVQRRFRDFGDQWNFALRELPIAAPWTMKLDPDERLSDALKASIEAAIAQGQADGLVIQRRLWFMERPLPIRQSILRVWRSGRCRFTEVAVNEHPQVDGLLAPVAGDLEHHDSPDLEHWIEKQNRYTSAEAVIRSRRLPLADQPRLFGTALQRQMFLKKHFTRLPLRFLLLFLFYWLVKGTWRAGWVGWAWARLRADVMRWIDYKTREIALTGREPARRAHGAGAPDPRVAQFD